MNVYILRLEQWKIAKIIFQIDFSKILWKIMIQLTLNCSSLKKSLIWRNQCLHKTKFCHFKDIFSVSFFGVGC